MIGALTNTAISEYEIEVVSEPDGLLTIRPDWERLTALSDWPNVFSTFEWCWGWWKYVGEGQAQRKQFLNVLILRRAGEITGIMPLMMRFVQRSGIVLRKIEFIGSYSLSDYQAPLFPSDPEGQTLAVSNHLARTCDQWDILELHNLAPGVSELLHGILGAGLRTRTARGEVCPFFGIDEPWNVMAQFTSKFTRQTLRNQSNRLVREDICVRIIENPEDETDLLDRMIAIERRKVTRGSPGEALLSRWPEFFQWLFKELGPKGWIGVALMEKGSELIAYNLFFRCGASIWDYSKAYNPAFAKLSPGTMLLQVIVDYAHARGYDEYDFLRGSEPYKMKWATGKRTTSHMQVWHTGWRSYAAVCMLSGIIEGRRLLQELERLRERLGDAVKLGKSKSGQGGTEAG